MLSLKSCKCFMSLLLIEIFHKIALLTCVSKLAVKHEQELKINYQKNLLSFKTKKYEILKKRQGQKSIRNKTCHGVVDNRYDRPCKGKIYSLFNLLRKLPLAFQA